MTEPQVVQMSTVPKILENPFLPPIRKEQFMCSVTVFDVDPFQAMAKEELAAPPGLEDQMSLIPQDSCTSGQFPMYCQKSELSSQGVGERGGSCFQPPYRPPCSVSEHPTSFDLLAHDENTILDQF